MQEVIEKDTVVPTVNRGNVLVQMLAVGDEICTSKGTAKITSVINDMPKPNSEKLKSIIKDRNTAELVVSELNAKIRKFVTLSLVGKALRVSGNYWNHPQRIERIWLDGDVIRVIYSGWSGGEDYSDTINIPLYLFDLNASQLNVEIDELVKTRLADEQRLEQGKKLKATESEIQTAAELEELTLLPLKYNYVARIKG
jgi:hypothetical protein